MLGGLAVMDEDEAATRARVRQHQIARGLRKAEPRAGLIALPANERGLSPEEIARFDKAHAELHSPRLTLGEKARAARARTMAAIEAKPEEEAERRWREGALKETVELAQSRGEEVEVKPSGGAEIRSRDPLVRLLKAGHLTPDQHEAAEALRECYEIRASDAGSQLGDLAPGSGSHDNHRFVASRYTRAIATDRAQAVERAILTGGYRLRDGTFVQIQAFNAFTPESPAHVGLTVIRAVCSENKPLSSLGEGRAYHRNLSCLVLALDVAYECLMGGRGRKP